MSLDIIDSAEQIRADRIAARAEQIRVDRIAARWELKSKKILKKKNMRKSINNTVKSDDATVEIRTGISDLEV